MRKNVICAELSSRAEFLETEVGPLVGLVIGSLCSRPELWKGPD